jgi:transcriptional regulator with XRE-family HTH domain
MTYADFRAARDALGLTVTQMATMLGVDPVHVRRMQRADFRPSHRAVTPTTLRLMQAYLDGYRPKDWPTNRRTK